MTREGTAIDGENRSLRWLPKTAYRVQRVTPARSEERANRYWKYHAYLSHENG